MVKKWLFVHIVNSLILRRFGYMLDMYQYGRQGPDLNVVTCTKKVVITNKRETFIKYCQEDFPELGSILTSKSQVRFLSPRLDSHTAKPPINKKQFH